MTTWHILSNQKANVCQIVLRVEFLIQNPSLIRDNIFAGSFSSCVFTNKQTNTTQGRKIDAASLSDRDGCWECAAWVSDLLSLRNLAHSLHDQILTIQQLNHGLTQPVCHLFECFMTSDCHAIFSETTRQTTRTGGNMASRLPVRQTMLE